MGRLDAVCFFAFFAANACMRETAPRCARGALLVTTQCHQKPTSGAPSAPPRPVPHALRSTTPRALCHEHQTDAGACHPPVPCVPPRRSSVGPTRRRVRRAGRRPLFGWSFTDHFQNANAAKGNPFCTNATVPKTSVETSRSRRRHRHHVHTHTKQKLEVSAAAEPAVGVPRRRGRRATPLLGPPDARPSRLL